MTCGVCGSPKVIGVFCVPGIPYSDAYCQECIDENAHPYHILTADCAMRGLTTHSLFETKAASYFKDMVYKTCQRLDVPISKFFEDVADIHLPKEMMRES